MTNGISTSPHCLYKSNIVDDVIINKTRQNELVKVFCEYKTEFLILFDDFFRSHNLPKPSPVLHHFFQYTHLRDAYFYRCKLIEHTVQFYFFKHKGITLLRLDVFDDRTSECLSEENAYKVDLKLGAKVTWVNLNRLIIDYFITPKDKVSVDFSTNLTVNNEERDFFLRSFCPVVNRASGEVYSVQDTEYKDMTFVPVSCYDRFISPSEDIKPMIELSDKNSKLRISAYSTLSAAQMSSNADGALTIVCSEEKEVELNAGETLASRVIFGFDYIEDVVPDDNEPNPFSCFL